MSGHGSPYPYLFSQSDNIWSNDSGIYTPLSKISARPKLCLQVLHIYFPYTPRHVPLLKFNQEVSGIMNV